MHSPARILIVDDNATNRAIIKTHRTSAPGLTYSWSRLR